MTDASKRHSREDVANAVALIRHAVRYDPHPRRPGIQVAVCRDDCPRCTVEGLLEQLERAEKALREIESLPWQTEAYHFNETAVTIARAALASNPAISPKEDE